ncbi:MAG: fibronectin type III domain-containing protein [Ignavibacteria bacterium]
MKNSFLSEPFIKKDNSCNRDINDSPGPVFATTGSLEGEILLQWDAIRDADKYIIQVTKKNSASSLWEQYDIVKDPLYCFTGLKPGKEYSFRVAAVYPDRTGAWSSVVSKKVK